MLKQTMPAAKAFANAQATDAILQWIRDLHRCVRCQTRDFLQLVASLDGDACAAFGAARVNHAATTNGFHANSESVRFFAACNGRLISTFHNYSLLIKSGWKELSLLPEQLGGQNSALSRFFMFLVKVLTAFEELKCNPNICSFFSLGTPFVLSQPPNLHIFWCVMGLWITLWGKSKIRPSSTSK